MLHHQGHIDVKSVTENGFEVARLGFEPRLKESESFVLPLHYQAIAGTKIVFGFGPPAKPESPENGMAADIVFWNLASLDGIVRPLLQPGEGDRKK